MAILTSLLDWITATLFRTTVDSNFTTLNTDKAELSGATFTWDVSVPDEAYGAGWNWSLEVPTKNAIYDKIQTIWGGWDALTTNPLSQFAVTTSAQLASVISDETWSGWSLVFSNSPALTTPSISAINVSGWTLTLPTGASDTLVWRNSTDTLTNKTLTSPTLTTPVLWTPTSWNLSNCTVDGTDQVGFRNCPINSQSAAYTLVLSDAGKTIYHPSADTTARTWTIPANSSVAYPIGTIITFENDISAGALTISITTDTLVLVGAAGSTGSRTLATGWRAVAQKVTSTRWRIDGNLLT